MPRIGWIALLLALVAAPAHALECADVLSRIGDQLAGVSCFRSTDLTTNGPSTTPANNSLPGLPALAFTPVTDRGVISPTVHTPITKLVPRLQLEARLADDPDQQARFLL